jgi:hypothetical protein
MGKMRKFGTDTKHFDIAQPIDLGRARDLSAWERARLAADWHAGRVDFRFRNATLIFKVSSPYICAVTKSNDKPAAPARALEGAWLRASDAERREFARAMAEALWGLLDELTVPPPS